MRCEKDNISKIYLFSFRYVSVGGESVWAINPADEVYVRVNLTKSDPKGKEWTKIDGSMKTVSVGPTGVCWAVDKKDTVWRRFWTETQLSVRVSAAHHSTRVHHHFNLINTRLLSLLTQDHP